VKSDLLAKSPLLALPIFALFLFLAVFLVMLVVTARRRGKSFDTVASLPLDDEGEGR
jgi:hypothetical protein